jgi:hypothetical protein
MATECLSNSQMTCHVLRETPRIDGSWAPADMSEFACIAAVCIEAQSTSQLAIVSLNLIYPFMHITNLLVDEAFGYLNIEHGS